MVLCLMPWGEALYLILFSFSIVFVLLLVIVVVLTLFGKIVTRLSTSSPKGRSSSEEMLVEEFESADEIPVQQQEEIQAAIAMALFELNQSVHDNERCILTFKRQEGRFSPWSSKESGLRNLQRSSY